MTQVISFRSKMEALSHGEPVAAHISATLAANAGRFLADSQRTWLPSTGDAVRCSSRFLIRFRLFEVVENVAGALLGAGILPGAKPLQGAVEKLSTAGNGRYHPYNKVEAEEDGFLCRSRGEAVHCVGARKAAAGELRLHLEAIELPLAH